MAYRRFDAELAKSGYPPRWGSTPTVAARRFAIGASNTRWGLTRRLRPRTVNAGHLEHAVAELRL